MMHSASKTTTFYRRWRNPTKILNFLRFRKNFSSSKGTPEEVKKVGPRPRERVDCVVIGAGVVGLAVARELSVNLSRQVLVIDSAPTFGTGTSSRNSEVIHAGIYYPPHSLKVSLSLLFSLNRFCSS